jgi:hypothetical protein
MSIRELMVARPRDRVSSVMNFPVSTISGHASEGAILNHPGWRTFHKIPVTEKGGLLVGIIRYKTLRKLEGIYIGPPLEKTALEFTFRLGEVYWVGIAAMIQSLNGAMRRTGKSKN